MSGEERRGEEKRREERRTAIHHNDRYGGSGATWSWQRPGSGVRGRVSRGRLASAAGTGTGTGHWGRGPQQLVLLLTTHSGEYERGVRDVV